MRSLGAVVFRSVEMSSPDEDQSARARDALFAGIAHDLRNPLNTFAMSTGLLKDDLESGQIDVTRALSLVKRMERAAHRMQHLIDDLIVASRLETQKTELTRKTEDVTELVHEAVATAAPITSDRGTKTVAGEIEPGLQASVDRNRIVQALVKAAAFTLRTTGEHGTITIGAKRGPGGNGIELHVHGINRGGAPASAPGREEGRGGLALLIAGSLVDAHGGTLDVRYDDGTKLTITLP